MVGDYQLTINVYSYSNPESKCAVCRVNPGDPPGCCDEYETTDPAVCHMFANGCDIRFSSCPRRLYTNNTTVQCPSLPTTYTSSPTANVIEMELIPVTVRNYRSTDNWVSFSFIINSTLPLLLVAKFANC